MSGGSQRGISGGLNEGVCGRLEVTESADEERDSSSANGIQGQEPRRWREEIKWQRGSEEDKLGRRRKKRLIKRAVAFVALRIQTMCHFLIKLFLDKDAETKEGL